MTCADRACPTEPHLLGCDTHVVVQSEVGKRSRCRARVLRKTHTFVYFLLFVVDMFVLFQFVLIVLSPLCAFVSQ